MPPPMPIHGFVAGCPFGLLAWAVHDAREGAQTSQCVGHLGQLRLALSNYEYDGPREVPLVLVLHAGGGSGQSAERDFGFNGLSDQEDFPAVYPDGVAHQLNDGPIGERFVKVRGVDDVDLIRAPIEHLTRNHKIDPPRLSGNSSRPTPRACRRYIGRYSQPVRTMTKSALTVSRWSCLVGGFRGLGHAADLRCGTPSAYEYLPEGETQGA
jgi:hypothetical protein